MPHRVLASLEVYLYRAAAAIVVVTPGWEAHFASLSIDPKKIFVLPNGAEPVAAEEGATAALADHRGSGAFTAVYAGAHGAANGLDEVLDAAADLAEVAFVLIGEGPEREKLMERARDEALANVQFRLPVPKSELGAFLGNCDVGIHVLAPWDLLNRGVSPNKIFDYMAAGLPIVSNCAEGLRHIVTDGDCGRLGGPGQLGSLIRDVQRASPEQRALWSRRGQELLTEKYSRAAVAAALTGLLNDVAQRR